MTKIEMSVTPTMTQSTMKPSIEVRFQWALSQFTLDVDFEIPGRGVTALFGKSGCGKTTLLRCMAGLNKPHDGFMRINGAVWQDANTFVPPHQRAIGYVFQEASLFPHLNVRSNIEYGWKRTPLSQRRVDVEEIIALLGIESLLAQKTDTLSGGQRQRVAIARALLCSPQLLLLDEPLASLDLDSRAEILPYLEQLHDRLEIPMVYVSHAPAEIAQLADHLVLVENGRVAASGSINDILTHPDLSVAHQEEASAVIEGSVIGHDRDFHLTQIAVPGGQMSVALREFEVGHRVRVRILARDVSIALEKPQQTSITNVLPARIVTIKANENSAQALLRLDLGGAIILARITRRSVALLDLKPDMIVYAQVKSVALMH